MEASGLWFQLNALHFIVCLLVCDEFHGLAQVVHTALQARDVTHSTAFNVLHNRLTSLQKQKCNSSRDDKMESTFSWFCELKEIAPFPVQMIVPIKNMAWRDPENPEKIIFWDYVQFVGKGKEAGWKSLYNPWKNESETNVCSLSN